VLEEDADSFNDEERQSMLSEVASQAGHMSRTVTDLITLARDGGATMAVRQGDISLGGVVAAAIEAADGVEVTAEVDDYTVRVDAERLAQAISHLVTNSRMYGHGRVHLKAVVANGVLTVEVHDDGWGIPTKHLSSIWNQFERGARRLDSTSPGIGVGLAIVRAVAAAHGGTASYRRSEVLGGACFIITVPTTAVAAPTTSPWAWELTNH
jgi:signal transduction histidine kinase